MDIFQKRYLKHQESKKEAMVKGYDGKPIKYSTEDLSSLKRIIENRRSQRIFNDQEVDIGMLRFAAKHAPTSCNRQAISLEVIQDKKEIEKLDEELVGGKGWLRSAKVVILFKPNMDAYKSPAEVQFMKYLDTGHISQNIQLMCEAIGVGSCFVNPNGKEDICGALAIGHYDKKAPVKIKNDI